MARKTDAAVQAAVDAGNGPVLAGVLDAEDRVVAAAERLAERMEGPRGGRLTALHRVLSDVGLEGMLDGPVEQVRRADQLGERVRALRAESERDRDGLVRRVLAGVLDPDDPDLLAGAVRYRALQPPDGAGSGAVSSVAAHAQAGLRDQAWSEVHGLAPEIMAALAKAAAETVGESVKLTKTLPSEVDDDRSAFRAGVAEAWNRLRELVDRFVALHSVGDHLRDIGLAPQPARGVEIQGVDWVAETPRSYFRYERPWKLPKDYPSVHPCRKLAAAVMAGAGPCLRGAREADSAYHERLRSEAKAKQARALGSAGVVVV